VLGWLTGELQDHANASSTLLYDVRTGDWAGGCWNGGGRRLTGAGAVLERPIRPSERPPGR